MDEESNKIIDFTSILEAEVEERAALLEEKILALKFLAELWKNTENKCEQCELCRDTANQKDPT